MQTKWISSLVTATMHFELQFFAHILIVIICEGVYNDILSLYKAHLLKNVLLHHFISLTTRNKHLPSVYSWQENIEGAQKSFSRFLWHCSWTSISIIYTPFN